MQEFFGVPVDTKPTRYILYYESLFIGGVGHERQSDDLSLFRYDEFSVAVLDLHSHGWLVVPKQVWVPNRSRESINAFQ